jgi:hypothetical protein
MTPTRIVLDTDPGLGAPGADIDDGLATAARSRWRCGRPSWCSRR